MENGSDRRYPLVLVAAEGEQPRHPLAGGRVSVVWPCGGVSLSLREEALARVWRR